MSGYVSITILDLAIAGLLVLGNAILSLALDLGVERRLIIAAVRMCVQLSLMGLALTWLFQASSPWLTALAALAMVAFAGREAAARQSKPMAGLWTYGIGTGAVLMAAGLVTVFALTTAIRPQPWYDPRYALPLLGMILGNAMTGVSLGIASLTSGLAARRAGVEARLMLGHDRRSALAPVIRESLRAALMPTINAMSATGLVSLPGMMTGQVLGGVTPMEAMKYQILIFFLIAGGTGLGAATAVLGATYRLTDHRHRLRLDRLGKGSQ